MHVPRRSPTLSLAPEDILDAALALPAGERSAYVESRCGDDSELRRRIERLIGLHARFPEPPRPPDRQARRAPRVTSVAGYVIRGELGRGGMGRVLLAEDPELGREVAIKMLPDALARDPDRIRRFRREARTLAGLRHPGIAIIHRFGVDGEHPYLVMECVPGKTLGERIAAGLEPDEAIAIVAQAADALAAAHDAGVVHRDVTPANVLVGPDSSVKLVDFGLAKAPDETATGERPAASAGVIGSPGYTSPEQLRGQPIDARSDLWSLGCVLFECLAGRPAFPGDVALERLMAVWYDEPDWAALPEAAARCWRPLLERCLAKAPEDRPASAAEVARELRGTPGSPPGPPPRHRSLVPSRVATAVGLVVIGVVSVLVWSSRRPGPVTPPVERAVATRQITFDGLPKRAAISPDGDLVALSAGGTQLMFLDLETDARVRSARFGSIRDLFWTRDGRELVVVGNEETRGRRLVTHVVSRGDSVARRVGPPGFVACDASPDRRRFIGYDTRSADPDHIALLDRDTGVITSLAYPPGLRGRPDVHWSPAADLLLVGGAGADSVRAAAWVVPVGRGERRRVETGDGSRGWAWSRDGTEIYYRSGGNALMALPVDPRSGRTRGRARVLLDRCPESVSLSSSIPARAVFVRTFSSANLWWAERDDADGSAPIGWTRLTSGTWSERGCRLSPDGRRAVFVRADRHPDLFEIELASGAITRLTDDDADEHSPAWSPDGVRLAYSDGDGVLVWTIDGERPRRLVTLDGGAEYVTWTRDGRVAYQARSVRGRGLVAIDPDRPGSEPVALVEGATGATLFQHAWSPDGRVLAAAGNRSASGDLRVWRLDLSDGVEHLLYDGWAAPVAWSSDGRRVYLVTDDPALRSSAASVFLSVPADGGAGETLFELPGRVAGWWNVSMSADGRRIIAAIANRSEDVWLLDGLAL